MIARLIIPFSISMALVGCGGGRGGGYYVDDGPPRHRQSVEALMRVPDAAPKKEPVFAPSLKAYRIGMKTYRPLRSSHGYREVGMASWYGKKFQGHKTANGERYNMYAMTAAHRTLPLPSYVRVTNLENHRSVVLRVNDRGPFKKSRIIDLSYAAALKLGVTTHGTARVEVVAVQPGEEAPNQMQAKHDAPESRSTSAAPALVSDEVHPAARAAHTYVQVGAFGDWHNANALKAKLALRDLGPVVLWHSQTSDGPLYRVLIGPFAEPSKLDSIKTRVAGADLGSPKIVKE